MFFKDLPLLYSCNESKPVKLYSSYHLQGSPVLKNFRLYSTSTLRKENLYVKELLANMLPDLLESRSSFSHTKLVTCFNLLDLKERRIFFNEIKNRGPCIYIFTYKHNDKVFYIGKTHDLRLRFNEHKKPIHVSKKFDKFHVLAEKLGWDMFTLSVVEFCSKEDLMLRENFYITQYLPILNTQMKASSCLGQGLGCQVWAYSYSNKTLTLVDNAPFTSITSAASHFNISTKRLTNHLGTNSCINVKGQLWVYFFRNKLDEVCLKNIVLNKAYNSHKGVWIYKISPEGEVSRIYNNDLAAFITHQEGAKAIKISPHTINKYIDSKTPYKEYYFSSVPKDIYQVKLIFEETANNRKGVWVYKEDLACKNKITLLYNQPFNSPYSAGRALNMGEDTIKKYINTSKSFKGLYFFSVRQTKLGFGE